ncbi:MAG: MBL fold metallo-hydrolase [Flavobacteriales bacterium]
MSAHVGKLTFLGSGTSQGVPVIACECPTCQSTDPHDKRLRASVLIELANLHFCIDAGPDFRQQMLRANVQQLDAILLTHEHKDHIAGLDDVRAFNYKQQADFPIYCSKAVEKALHREFYYAFEPKPYPGVPQFTIKTIENKSFLLADRIHVDVIEVLHHRMPVFGFRLGNLAYITDAKTIAPQEKLKLKGLDTLIINALHEYQHQSHFNLDEALELISELQPKQSYLTHISHLFGKHQVITKKLPPNVSLAHDGLCLDFQYFD